MKLIPCVFQTGPLARIDLKVKTTGEREPALVDIKNINIWNRICAYFGFGPLAGIDFKIDEIRLYIRDHIEEIINILFQFKQELNPLFFFLHFSKVFNLALWLKTRFDFIVRIDIKIRMINISKNGSPIFYK